MVRDLLKEGQLDVFQKRFAEILAYLRVERQTEMAEYLTENYLGKVPSWASFADKTGIMDTTMISERWHHTLKEDILHRNANCRIDRLVDLLIRAVEEKSESTEIMSISEVVCELCKDDFETRKENLLAAAPGVQESATGVQLRREQRYQKLNEIMSTYAALEIKAKAIARTDADDSLNNLEEILRYFKLASMVAPHQSCVDPAPRPELAKEGAKPRLKWETELLPVC
uniref:FRIGIDA-like protein n=1 Tax=Haemonchus contortus TaxID=6289 RepID=A0A7I4YHW0_HAECO